MMHQHKAGHYAGDTQITLAQRVVMRGVAMVTTPQEVALADVRRSLGMFQKVDVPVLGVIENMAYHICGACGAESALFGRGGGARLAEEAGVPLLGRLPLDSAVMEGGESGTPVVLAHRDSAIAHSYVDVAQKLAAVLASSASRD
jgi:ATP-binding protein involved in chromosome partitioning